MYQNHKTQCNFMRPRKAYHLTESETPFPSKTNDNWNLSSAFLETVQKPQTLIKKTHFA